MSSGFVRITEEEARPQDWFMVQSKAGGVYANHCKKAVQICLNNGMDSVTPGVYSAQFGTCEERHMGSCARISVWPDSRRKEPDEGRVTKMADILREALDIPESGILARAQGASFVYLYVALEDRELGVTWRIHKDAQGVFHISCISRHGFKSRRIERSLPDRDSLHAFVHGDGAKDAAKLCREVSAAGYQKLASAA